MGRTRKIKNFDEILKASYHLFMLKGYDNVSLLDIQKECGVQTRGFYRYFKKKDEVLGTIIESIEKKMIEYLSPVLTKDPSLSFVLFSIMKYEYAIANSNYFRLRASFIARPDTFIKGFMKSYELSYPQNNNWKSDENTLLQGLYVLGGMFLVQYGFLKNLSGDILTGEGVDFMTNYNILEISSETSDTYRRFMRYAIRNDLRILGLADSDIEAVINKADIKFRKIDVYGFKTYYENELGFY